MKNKLTQLIFFLFGLLPQKSLPFLSCPIGWILKNISPRRKGIVQKNIDLVYRELECEPPANFVNNIYRHFALTALEILRLPSRDESFIKAQTTLLGQEHLDAALKEEKGIIGIAAHMGNWEYSLATLAVNGYDSRIILKEQRGVDNDFINHQIRGKFGIKSIKKSSGIKDIIKSFKQNAVIGMVIDQRAKQRESTTAKLFGLEAKTYSSPITLALKTKAPLIPIHSFRDEKGQHTTIIGKEIALIKDSNLSQEELVQKNTLLLHQWFEKSLLEHPEQWIWMHQRWSKELY